MSPVTWECHGCHEWRDDVWISVAHRKFLVNPESVPMQINLRYCNDRPACIRKVADVLDQVEARLRAALFGAAQ